MDKINSFDGEIGIFDELKNIVENLVNTILIRKRKNKPSVKINKGKCPK